jgi:predicted nucleic-acid-binding protein
MIGVDTNVLVRYIVQDDDEQTKLATNWLEQHCTVEQPAFINRIVLCEVVWVLQRAYKYDKNVITEVLKQLLNTENIIIEDSQLAQSALHDYITGNADFSDYLIAHVNQSKNCTLTLTFDKKASQHPLFETVKK